jgi:nucleotide-binding universal stress UspA family protein
MRESGMQQDNEHRIVVGVSGSKASIAALRWAAEQARDRHARLDVVRAWEDPPPRAPYALERSVSGEAGPAEAGRQLQSIVRTALGTPDATMANAEVTRGRAARALVDRCSGADMLVLGAHQPANPVGHPAGPPPVGPVIRACLRGAPCPVVIVRAGDRAG